MKGIEDMNISSLFILYKLQKKSCFCDLCLVTYDNQATHSTKKAKDVDEPYMPHAKVVTWESPKMDHLTL